MSRLQVCKSCAECITIDGKTTDCRVGKLCCGGALSRGPVDLISGVCNRDYWPKKLESWFDRVVVISLERRPDRLAQFWKGIDESNWPFKKPEIFKAIDGNKVPTPAGWVDDKGIRHNQWRSGGGAWGCMQSHRHILEQAIIDGVKSLLVLEDDARPSDDFINRCHNFFNIVPRDWDGLMLGGQHFGTTEILPNLNKCSNCQRTHAYAIRGHYMRDLYAMWHSYFGHCDHAMGPFQNKYKVYSPNPFIIGQARSRSDISGRLEGTRFWSGNDPYARLVYLKAPPPVLKAIRTLGVHTGHNRDPITDIDLGIKDIFQGGHSPMIQIRKLRDWIGVVRSEAAAFETGCCAIWYPETNPDQEHVIRKAAGSELIELEVNSIEEFLAEWSKYVTLTARKPTDRRN